MYNIYSLGPGTSPPLKPVTMTPIPFFRQRDPKDSPLPISFRKC